MGLIRLFILTLLLSGVLSNHRRTCRRSRTGRVVCTNTGSHSQTSSRSSRTSKARTQNTGFLNRFTGGFGPNARIGVGLFASDRFRPNGFQGEGFSPSQGFLFRNGPFRTIPNRPLARWSNLPFGFV